MWGLRAIIHKRREPRVNPIATPDDWRECVAKEANFAAQPWTAGRIALRNEASLHELFASAGADVPRFVSHFHTDDHSLAKLCPLVAAADPVYRV